MSRSVNLIFLLLMSGGIATAQNQYVSLFDYRTLAVTPVAHVPGVSWVSGDNSTLDINHQRFFFEGGPKPQTPWNLYCVDATTGAVLSSPFVPSNDPNSQVVGLQYDNTVDTLYGIYSVGSGNIYFVWIEISTGIVHTKQLINNGFNGYFASTYDVKDHLYIAYSNMGLTAIDARTGYILNSPKFPGNAGQVFFGFVYDNANSRLYGCDETLAGPVNFDSISPVTGQIYPLATLPIQEYPYFTNICTIDEGAGNFVFVGTIPTAANCIHYKLYTIDIPAAKIVDSVLYPYAEDPTNPIDSNMLAFSYDNRHGLLYALNWRPTLQSIPPVINVTVAVNPTCPGKAEIFCTLIDSVFATTNYEWLVNSQPVGSNTPTYSDANPLNGDSIRCILTATTACGSTVVDTSTPVILTVPPIPSTSVSITGSSSDICSGDTVEFQATSVNGGGTPQFQWLINGQPTGQNSDLFQSSTLADGDTIACVLQGSLFCSLSDTSGNKLVMTVRETPLLRMPPDTLIKRGQEVPLMPLTGGAIMGYQWEPATGLSSAFISDPVALPLSTTTYQLLVSGSDGCNVSGKTTISVSTPLFMPNAYSPNGDGSNDIFRIPPSLGIVLARFSVFDRWGQQVFTTTNVAEGWNGLIRGNIAPVGVYVWVVEYTDSFTGARLAQHGTVMLVR
jgi:gliding motility-associated-like protein